MAQRLGVTRHYARKHDILRALLMGFFDMLEAAVISAHEAHSGPADRFRAILRAHFTVVAMTPLTSRIFALEENSLPLEEREEVMRRRRRQQARFTDAYREGAKAGVLRDVDPALAVSVLLGAGNWMYRLVRLSGPWSPAQIVEFAEELLFSGYVVRASRTTR